MKNKIKYSKLAKILLTISIISVVGIILIDIYAFISQDSNKSIYLFVVCLIIYYLSTLYILIETSIKIFKVEEFVLGNTMKISAIIIILLHIILVWICCKYNEIVDGLKLSLIISNIIYVHIFMILICLMNLKNFIELKKSSKSSIGKIIDILVSIIIIICFVIISYGLIYYGYNDVYLSDTQGIDVKSIIKWIYFSSYTYFTVGYGDSNFVDNDMYMQIFVQIEMLLSHILTLFFIPGVFNILADTISSKGKITNRQNKQIKDIENIMKLYNQNYDFEKIAKELNLQEKVVTRYINNVIRK